MTEPGPRPLGIGLVVVAALGAGAWGMAHLYSDHDPGVCGGRYLRAATAADSAAVDRFVPDSERTRLQPRPCGFLGNPDPVEFARADSLITRAIAATGGDSALAHLATIEWQGTATAGDPATERSGIWRLAPPDTEVVTTWRAADSAATLRRLVVMGGTVSAGSNGDSVALSPEERSAERHLAYLYSLLRLVPFREPGTLYWPLPADSAGRPGVLVRIPTRLDVALTFGADGRIAELRTTTIPTPGAPPSISTVTLEGDLEVAGVHWFREMRVVRDGTTELTLTIAAARPATLPTSRWLADTERH